VVGQSHKGQWGLWLKGYSPRQFSITGFNAPKIICKELNDDYEAECRQMQLLVALVLQEPATCVRHVDMRKSVAYRTFPPVLSFFIRKKNTTK
jgi:hypothetical protein